MTKPTDISGRWTGEEWTSVTLSTVAEATGWYTGSMTDTEGRRGALQLEWSRLQQRYSGRWTLGDEQSGSLTLRTRGNELRGAISIDPDSRVAEGMPRLYEFSWQRAEDGATKVEDSQHATTSKGPPTTIESPISGHIARWGDGIRENAFVKKGIYSLK